MRVLIGTYEIAGLVKEIQTALESLGYNVTSAIFTKHSFYTYNYNIDLLEKKNAKRNTRKVKKTDLLGRVIKKSTNLVADIRFENYIKDLIDKNDLIIIIWNPFLESYKDFEYIKRKGKKLIVLFVGTDVRYFKCFEQEFDISHWIFPADFANVAIDLKLKHIRFAEKYADLVYSVPDQAGLQLRPYFHLQLPVCLENLKFNPNSREIPRIVHIPTIAYRKGSDIIVKTMEKLKEDSVMFEFKTYENISNVEVLQILQESDILIDEIVAHGPGILSFEAMASGCAVATRYLENSPANFRPPVWSIDASNIYLKMKELIQNVELRKKLVFAGRDYLMENNNSKNIVQEMIDKLYKSPSPDYSPTFLRNSYRPTNDYEIQQINKYNLFVKDCDWYQQTVSPGERAGLIF